MGRIDQVWYELDLRTKGFDTRVRQVEQQLKSTAETIRRYPIVAVTQLNDSLNTLQSEMRDTAAASERMRTAVKDNQTVLLGMQRALQGVGLALGTRELAEFADTWLMTAGRIRTVTASQQEAIEVQSRLFELAQETRSDFRSTVELFVRLAQGGKELGISQEKLLTITKAVNQAFQVSGATAQEARNATIQLSQALASGQLRGDELRSVLEQAPRLARAIADELNVGIGQIRTLAAQGVITSDLVARAVLKRAKEINEEFEKLPVTISSAWQTVVNAMTKATGELSEMTTAGATVAELLMTIGRNFGVISNAAIAFAALAGARVFSKLGTQLTSYIARQALSVTTTREQIRAEVEYREVLAQRALAERNSAARMLERAKAANVAAIAQYREAMAMEDSAAKAKQRERALTRVLTTQQRLDDAQKAYDVTNQRYAAATTKVTDAINMQAAASTAAGRAKLALRNAGASLVNFLGGPLGAALTATAAGFMLMARNTKIAQEEADKFRKSVSGMTVEQYDMLAKREQSRLNAARARLMTIDAEREQVSESLKAGEIGVDTWNRRQRQFQNQREAIEKEIDSLKILIATYDDLRAQAEAANNSVAAKKAANEQETVEQLSALIRTGQASAAEMERANTLVRQFRAELSKLREEDTEGSRKRRIVVAGYIDALTKTEQKEVKLGEARAQAYDRFQQQLASMKASLTTEKVDDFAAALARLDAQAKKLNLTPQQQQDYEAQRAELVRLQAAKMADASAELGRQLQAQLIREIGGQADWLRHTLAEFHRDIEAKAKLGISVDPELVKKLTEAHERAIALAEEAERFDLAMLNVDHNLEKRTSLLESLQQVQVEITRAEAERAQALARINAGDKSAQKDYDAAQQKKNAAKERELNIQIELNKLTNIAATRTAKIAKGVADAANAAFGLTSAMQGVNAEATRIVSSISHVASGIQDVAELASTITGGFGGIFSSSTNFLKALPGFGQIIGGGLALGESLFGKSAERERLIQTQRENTRAIRELTKEVGDLGRINVTGERLVSVQSALGDAAVRRMLDQFRNSPALGDAWAGSDFARVVNNALKRVGLDYRDLVEFAKEFNITLDATKIRIKDIQDVIDAMSQAELTRFSETHEGQMQAFQAEIDLFDISDPIEQLEKLRKVLTDPKFGAPALREALAGLDFTTTEGRERARLAIERLFRSIQAGTLDPKQLGGLTAQDLLQSILEVSDLLRDAERAIEGETRNFSVNRTITEITGNRIASLLTTDQVIQRQILEAIRELVDQPELRDALAGFDVSTLEGRAEMQQAIERLFDSIRSELATIHGESMAQRQRMLDQLVTLTALLQRAGTVTPVEALNVMTNTTAPGLDPHLVQMQQATVEHINRWLERVLPRLRPIEPPTQAQLQAYLNGQTGGSSAPVIGRIDTIHITLPEGVTDSASDAGQLAAEAFLNHLDRELGLKLRRRRVSAGNLIIT